MLTKQQIIEETVEFYQKNNRSVSKGECLYYHNGDMCAVGRCLINPKDFQDMNDESIRVIDKILTLDDKNLDDYFKEEYRGHQLRFWTDLQTLHDQGVYWNEHSLTEMGKDKYKSLLKQWKDV